LVVGLFVIGPQQLIHQQIDNQESPNNNESLIKDRQSSMF
jgi:hypothetical protein